MDHKGRQAIMSNLRQILTFQGVQPSDKHLRGMARKTFQHFGKYLVDFFRSQAMSRKKVLRDVEIAHPEYLAQCHGLGRGVIVVTAHLGNWEMGGAILAALGYVVNAVALPYRHARIEKLVHRCRMRRGIRPIPVKGSIRTMIQCLKRGEMVALLSDRDFTVSPEPLSFFGRPAYLPRGPAWLALRTGAPILPGFLVRQPDDRYLMILHEPILVEPGMDELTLRERIRDCLQEEIATHPVQWYIFEEFWDLENHGTEQRHIPASD